MYSSSLFSTFKLKWFYLILSIGKENNNEIIFTNCSSVHSEKNMFRKCDPYLGKFFCDKKLYSWEFFSSPPSGFASPSEEIQYLFLSGAPKKTLCSSLFWRGDHGTDVLFYWKGKGDRSASIFVSTFRASLLSWT